MWYWIAVVLGAVRLIESLFQLGIQPEAKGLISKAKQLFLNFFWSLETYKK